MFFTFYFSGRLVVYDDTVDRERVSNLPRVLRNGNVEAAQGLLLALFSSKLGFQ